MSSLLDDVLARLPALGGTAGLTVKSTRGAGPLGWDPIDPHEAAEAEIVIMEGPDCFGAVCRLRGRVRYICGLNGNQPDSRMWPMGEATTLEKALSMVVDEARKRHETPPGK